MMELLFFGAVLAGAYLFIKAIWNYEMSLAKVTKK